VRRGRIKEYARSSSGQLHPGQPQAGLQRPVEQQGDCAFPSATQNEINAKDARNLLKNGVYVVSEGANMPTTPDGGDFLKARILYGPGKAPTRAAWRRRGWNVAEQHAPLLVREEVDRKLHDIMKSIHQNCWKPPRSTALPATTSTAPTSPASSRWPTR